MQSILVSDSILDPHSFNTELEQILAILYNLEKSEDTHGHSAVDISNMLRDDYGINMHWRSIDAILSKHKQYVVRKKRSKRWVYKLLAQGISEMGLIKQRVTIVGPENALQAVRELHTVFEELEGSIRFCDPYLAPVSIEHLEACNKTCPIQFLTSNIQKSGRVRRLLSAAKTESYNIQIRKTDDSVIHDRYVIDSKSMYIFGTSLNGFGKKQCFVTCVGSDIRAATLSDYSRKWAAAHKWQ